MEIPVVHEVSRGKAGATTHTHKLTESVTSVSKISISPSHSSSPSSSSSSVASPSTASVNHRIAPPVASPRRLTARSRDSSSNSNNPSNSDNSSTVTMHKEEVRVTRTKPKTPAKPLFTKTGEPISSKSPQPTLHARLPSTDSGIQADGGFDSLSRYKGKTFLSANSGCDSVFSEPESTCSSGTPSNPGCSGSSSGYSSDHSYNSLPRSLSSKVISVPSQAFFASSKPVIPSKPATSLASASSYSSATLPARGSTRPGDSSYVSSISRNKPVLNRAMSEQTSAVSNSASKSHIQSSKWSSPTISEYQNADNQSSDLPTSTANQKTAYATPVASPRRSSGSEPIRAAPSVKVVTSDGGVKLSFTKNSINISTSNPPPTFNQSASSTPSHDPSSVHSDSARSCSQTVADCGRNGPSTTIFSAPGSTFRLQVFNSHRQTQPENNSRHQGQGCIALTRPLRLGNPSKVSVRAVQPTTLSSQSANYVSTVNQTPPQQRQPGVSSGVVKPKIAPRPSVLAKNSSGSPTRPILSASTVTTTTTSAIAPTSASTTTTAAVTAASSNSSITTVTVSSTAGGNSATNHTSAPRTVTPNSLAETGSVHKTNAPVVHRIKTTTSTAVTGDTERTEIPVTHVIHRVSGKSPNYHTLPARPSSFTGFSSSRYTPERDRHHQQQQHKQPIYENIKFNLKDGFSFDDHDTRMRHAELVLKQSDELISDALKMLNTAPAPATNGFSHSAGKFPDDERVVEGSDDTGLSLKEHTVPVFDVRTGKYHPSLPRPSWTEAKTGEGGAKEDTWKDRKERIDSALSWLKTELAGLRDMDNILISQFRRCQDTIETLKTQRDIWEGLSEEGEEGEYWDDFELNEFNRRYLDSPGGSSSSQFSPGSRDNSLHDVTSLTLPVPQLHLPQDRKSTNGHHSNGMKQDLEVTL